MRPRIPDRQSVSLLVLALAVFCTGAGFPAGAKRPASVQVPANPQIPPLRHEVRVVNVEVPVRVYKGETFVNNLTLGDFEVLEDGIPQDVEAVYLIDKTTIARREESRPFSPETARSFYLLFVLYEYNPRIREAVGIFVNQVLRPDDRLFIVTPRTTYRMKPDLLAAAPKDKIADQLTGLIRKDILAGDLAYRSILSRLKRMSGSKVRPIESQLIDPSDLADMGFNSEEEFLMQLRADLAQLEDLRRIDEAQLFNFAEHLKTVGGQKHVFLFYQREFTPTLDKGRQLGYVNDPVLAQFSADLAGYHQKMSAVAVERLKKACADSQVTVSFLYLTTVPTDIGRDQMEERSWDVFQAFSGMAQATGGVVSSSSNTAALMERAAAAAESYYLLYYSPKDKTPDGKFRTIEVRTKPDGLRVVHLAGYTAR